MADNLVIVESPSKAKTIKKYLGKNYEVIASDGHIIDIPASRFGIDVDNDFELEYIKMRGKAKKINEIKKKAKDFKNILLAPDPDREGEAIAFHLKNILEIKDNEKCRISFNEITKEAVKKAVSTPRNIDMSLVSAQQTRRALDRVVGYKISPLLWKKVKRGLSAGRVQSSVMKIIIDREREIRNFKPQEYWNLEAILDKDKSEVLAKFYGNIQGKMELTNEKDTMKIVKEIKSEKFLVVDVKKSEKKRNPSPPFTTSSLGQDASRKLGFTIKKTMMVAQKLYEAGHITYMRTDSTRLSDDAKKMAKDYIVDEFGNKYYTGRNFKSKNNAQDAHEAIRPTKLDDISSKLSNDELKLYTLILNRFLASQMSVAIYDTTKITYNVKDYIFNSTGSIMKFEGFMKLYKPAEKEETNILPDIEINENLKQKKLNYEQKFTKPPLRFTEASLIKILEEKGIGRPSTYAPTISTITARLYIEREGKYLVPTEIGEIVNEVLENNFDKIVDEEFTAQMENTLDDISEGKETYLKTMQDFYNPFIKKVETAEEKLEKVKIEDEVSDVICDKCGKNMVIKHGRYGKFLACPGYPECKNIKSIVVKIDEKCPKCGGEVIVKKSKKGRTFYVCENSPKTCDYISWNKPSKDKK